MSQIKMLRINCVSLKVSGKEGPSIMTALLRLAKLFFRFANVLHARILIFKQSIYLFLCASKGAKNARMKRKYFN